MSLSAIEILDPEVAPVQEKSSRQDTWLDRMIHCVKSKRVNKSFHSSTVVHPCVINGERVLVYEKGLRRRNPKAYNNLGAFAEENNFSLKEDERNKKKEVSFERRRAKTAPLLLLASGLFMNGVATAEQEKVSSEYSNQPIPEITVKAVREKKAWERSYSVKNGKRFVTDPYGDVESILKVASEAKKQGRLKRVSTRGIKMPQEYVGGVLNRYDYKFPEECGGQKFSYYEGEGFGALGYHNGSGVILDVMVGGGPFTAPQLWGPYDQILGDKHNSTMRLMMGDGGKDGMGLLKAAYAIGMTAKMPRSDFKDFGDQYMQAVNHTANCMINFDSPSMPVLQQAKNEY
jgi:hypothetical protein